MPETDYNGNKLSYQMFGNNGQLTVGKLKEILKEYEDDTLIYMEPVNAYLKANTCWSQKVSDTYPVKDTQHQSKKALMMVGGMQ